MYLIFSILILIVCLLLMLVVLVQNPKGGGLSSTFGGGGTQMFGVQKTTDFLEKNTWTLAIALISLILLSNFAIDRGEVIIRDSGLREQMEQAPAFPSATPAPNAAGDNTGAMELPEAVTE